MSHSAATLTAPAYLAQDLEGVVEGLKHHWRAGTAPPDATGAIDDYPALARNRSLFVDLAYEEYCLREEAGAAPDADAFCRGLPAFRSQVREVLRGHCLMADNPGLFAPTEVTWPEPGEVVERLRIVRELGRGAFARVYLATDPDAGDRPVALKLSPTPSPEAGTLGPLNHPHIGTIHWARPVGNLFALCMPYVGSATLADAIATNTDPPTTDSILSASGGNVPPSAVVSARMPHSRAIAAIGARLADALAHLHRAGIAHGDLKPSNVLLGPGGHPYLIDFNLSQGSGASLHRCGGTLPYMAPERVRSMTGRATAPMAPAPADIYSFGAMLFEALTGRVPVEPSEVGTRMPPPVATGAPTIPVGFARLIDRCLSADPAARPAAAELARRLATFSRPSRFWPVFVGVLLLGGGLTIALGGAPAEPRTPAEFVTRGLDHLKAGRNTLAERDFITAQNRGKHPRAIACQGYCAALNGQHAAAINLFDLAIADDYAPAWVYNNAAYCLLQGRERMAEADAHASRAIELSPDARAPRYTRARIRLASDLDRGSIRLKHLRCRDDLEAALVDGPTTADQYFTKALILAASGPEPTNPTTVIVDLLREAIRLGYPAATILRNPVLVANLGDDQGFQALSAPTKVEKSHPVAAYGLMSPLD